MMRFYSVCLFLAVFSKLYSSDFQRPANSVLAQLAKIKESKNNLLDGIERLDLELAEIREEWEGCKHLNTGSQQEGDNRINLDGLKGLTQKEEASSSPSSDKKKAKKKSKRGRLGRTRRGRKKR